MASLGDDRSFLANVPGLQFSKPLGNLSPSYVHRLANSIRRQEGQGVPVSRQAARGHVVTPEHGKGGRGGARPKLPAAPQEYRAGKLPKSKYLRATRPLPRPIVHRTTVNPPEREDFSDGSVAFTFRERNEFHETGAMLARLRESGTDRVILSGYDCEHNIYRSLGVNSPHSRGWTAYQTTVKKDKKGQENRMALYQAWAASQMDFDDWFMLMANSTDSDPQQEAIPMDHICLWQLYVYPRGDIPGRR